MKSNSKQKKPIYKRWWFVAIIIVLIIGGISGTLKDDSDIAQNTTTSKNSQNKDLEIITKSGHPTYYGLTSQAHKVWDNIDKEKIIFPDSYDKYSDKAIITLGGNSSDEENSIIRDIQIYFQNFSSPMNISLDKALKIAGTYLPYDIISQWYEFSESYCLQPNEPDEDDMTYYIVSYHLTDGGSDAFYAGEHLYSGSIDIIFEVNQKNVVNYFTIGFGTPRWMSSLGTSGYKSVDWEYDFSKNHKN